MFVNDKGCNSIEDYLITEDRWNDILYHMEHSLFWDKKLHALDIENIMYALKTHKFVNDSEVLQTNYYKASTKKLRRRNNLSYADNVYKNLVNDICANGTWDYNEDVRTHYKDGEKAYAKSLFGYQVKFPKGVVPLITTKKVFTQTAIKEMLLFWVHQTVKKEDFDNWNVKIWNEWMKDDGTLGDSYAAQFQKGERNQVVELIKGIKENPKSRRLMTSFWDFENAPNKALQECAWATQWDVRNGCLNLILIQRSVDTALGLPFNWFQYSVLQHLIAHCCDLEVGEFTHQMGNVHYYNRHQDLLLEQVKSDIYVSEPKILINESLKDFFNTEISDITLLDYKCSKKNFKYDIAV